MFESNLAYKMLELPDVLTVHFRYSNGDFDEG